MLGLRKVDTTESLNLAKKIATRWLYSNLAGFQYSNQQMYEKYDGRLFGYRGFGGEYEPQDGFGWSNGVAFCFLEIYGSNLHYMDVIIALNFSFQSIDSFLG